MAQGHARICVGLAFMPAQTPPSYLMAASQAWWADFSLRLSPSDAVALWQNLHRSGKCTGIQNQEKVKRLLKKIPQIVSGPTPSESDLLY